jgi:G3E family GTPase
MKNGCVCCFVDVRNDLVKILQKLINREDRFDQIVIETSGLAAPTPVATSFFVDNDVAKALTLDGIVTLVDAKHINLHIEDSVLDGRDNQAVDQIVAADRIVINKIDLVDSPELAQIESNMRRFNQTAEIVRSSYGKVELDKILGICGFQPSMFAERAKLLNLDDHGHHHHEHDPTVSSESFVFSRPFDGDRLKAWFAEFLQQNGHNVFRAKGILSIAAERRFFVLQAVHQLLDFRPDHPKANGEHSSKLVFIGRELDRGRIEAGLATCLA